MESPETLLIYKFEAFELFKEMIVQVNKDVISFLFKGELPQENQQQIREARQEKTNKNLKEQKDEIQNLDERSSISSIVDDKLTLHKGVPIPSWIELSLIDVCNRKCSFCPKSDPTVAPDTYHKMTML